MFDEKLLKVERETISFIKTNWLYQALQAGTKVVSIADTALPPPMRLVKTRRNHRHSVMFENYIAAYGDFLMEHTNYRTQVVKIDDIAYIIDSTTDDIVGGVVLQDKKLFGLYEMFNFIQNSCKGKFSIHSKLIHFSDPLDKQLYKMIDFSILNN